MIDKFTPAQTTSFNNGLAFDRSGDDDAKYQAVTLDDVKGVAAKCLLRTTDNFVVSVVKTG